MSTTDKIGDLFSNGQKIFSAIVAFILAISTMAIAYYKINDNAMDIDNVDKKTELHFDALEKKMDHMFDDQHELIIKAMMRNREEEEQTRKDEIEAAYFRGKVDEYMKEHQK